MGSQAVSAPGRLRAGSRSKGSSAGASFARGQTGQGPRNGQSPGKPAEAAARPDFKPVMPSSRGDRDTAPAEVRVPNATEETGREGRSFSREAGGRRGWGWGGGGRGQGGAAEGIHRRAGAPGPERRTEAAPGTRGWAPPARMLGSLQGEERRVRVPPRGAGSRGSQPQRRRTAARGPEPRRRRAAAEEAERPASRPV